MLETQGVPVIGLQTDEFPAFYSRESGLQVNLRVETPQEAAQIALAHWQSGVEGAVLLVVPPPEEVALPARQVESWIDQALREAGEKHIHGPAVTPFLLDRVAHLSGGASLQANLGLLFNNARVAAEAAAAIPGPPDSAKRLGYRGLVGDGSACESASAYPSAAGQRGPPRRSRRRSP